MARDDVRNALWRDRTLVKTWAMRGTLHLVASDELPELVGGLGTRINWMRPLWLRYFEVTAEEMLALQDGIGDVLTDRPMTRAALGEALATKLGNPAFADRVTSSWGTFLKPAASRGLLCFGPDDGRNVTFVDPRAWLGVTCPSRARTRSGPSSSASSPPFPAARKASSPAGGASRAARRCASRSRRSATASSRSSPRGPRCSSDARTSKRSTTSTRRPTVRLLPAFDPYTLSLQKEAEPLLPLARRPLVSRTAGWISQVVIVGGAVVATWTHEVKKGRLVIDVAPWRRLTKAERTAIDGEAARIGAFLDAEPDVTIGATV